MGEERRKTLRKTFAHPAGLYHPDGKAICGCVMQDISDEGARLKIEPAKGAASDEIPAEFILAITRSGNVIRRCKLIWRHDNELGVHFSEA